MDYSTTREGYFADHGLQCYSGPGTDGIERRPRQYRCWDHECDGRTFATFSNLLRHQREKEGLAPKFECADCRATFTRSTARNLHAVRGLCKRAKKGERVNQRVALLPKYTHTC
jgi:hypothetical protein